MPPGFKILIVVVLIGSIFVLWRFLKMKKRVAKEGRARIQARIDMVGRDRPPVRHGQAPVFRAPIEPTRVAPSPPLVTDVVDYEDFVDTIPRELPIMETIEVAETVGRAIGHAIRTATAETADDEVVEEDPPTRVHAAGTCSTPTSTGSDNEPREESTPAPACEERFSDNIDFGADQSGSKDGWGGGNSNDTTPPPDENDR